MINIRILGIGAGVALAAAGLAQTHSFAPEDVLRLQTVADPQISPAGDEVAYVVTDTDLTTNRRVPSIWVVPSGGGEPKRFLDNASAPRWSPDGKWLAFLAPSADGPASDGAQSARRSQVWIAARDGAARRMATHMAGGVSAYAWSPDATQLAVVSREPANPRDVRDYTSLLYKADGSGWFDHSRSHIYIADLSGGAVRQLTRGADSNDSDPQWSHDGKWIAYVSEESGPELRDGAANGDILIVPAAGGSPRIVCRLRAYAGMPRWSPDDSQLAYAAARTAADQPTLWIAPLSNPEKSEPAGDADLFPDEIEWAADGLWFGAKDHGAASLYRIEARAHRAVKILGGQRALHNLRIAPAVHAVVYLENDATHPSEVFLAGQDGLHERRLTFHNREFLSSFQFVPSQRLSWNSADGFTIEGFLKRPADWRPGRKYPMILLIHGGPNGMFGFQWSAEEQLYSSAGYAVLLTNPRGSSGYGARFQRAVAGQWGGAAYQDILGGVEAALQGNPWIDRDRVGVAGHSYGGFMTNWIVTQTGRFKGAVSISGISDLISVEGTRDGAYGHSRDFGGDLFENFDAYWRFSPLRLAARVKTPILFLHGDADQRVPLSQAEEFFRAIKHFGGTAELVVFPRENHLLPLNAEPRHLLETYQWRLYWFNRWLKGDPTAAPPGAN